VSDSAVTEPRLEKLSIGRIMVLMAGLGVALVCFGPQQNNFSPRSLDDWRGLASAVLIGFSLPGVYYALRRSRQGVRLGAGGLLWLTQSLGSWLLMPPAVAGPLLHLNTLGSGSAGACLFYVLPLVSLWFILASVLSGQLRFRHLRGETPWTDRFGFYLGLAWTVLGIWITGDFYWEAFFK
jgi:hypothetical protein